MDAKLRPLVPILISTLLLAACGRATDASSASAGKSGDGTAKPVDDPAAEPVDDPSAVADSGGTGELPHYFIAIHNEPYHHPDGERMLQREYPVLQEMIARADQYGIKLTLMFTAQWADYIMASAARQADLAAWKQSGHEIAAHHHSIYHGNWDGYSAYTPEEAQAQRERRNEVPEPYLGTLDDYTVKLQQINPAVRSGCVNDEADKRALPDVIVHDTCSGFANYGEVGTRRSDADEPQKGRNDYLTVGNYNGIQRKWLTHYQITKEERQLAAQGVFEQMTDGVYGAVTHSTQSQAEPYYAFLAFLHARDPQGSHSRTVAEIIDEALLPEEAIDDALLAEVAGSDPPRGRCGDGTCGPVEQQNPDLCPADCNTVN